MKQMLLATSHYLDMKMLRIELNLRFASFICGVLRIFLFRFTNSLVKVACPKIEIYFFKP